MDWAAVLESLPGSPLEKDQYAFRKKGELWEFTFEGQAISVAATKGMAYIAELIRAPGRKIFVADLFFAVHGEAPVRLGDSGEALDDKARREYRRRAEALRDQLAEAERNNDLGRSGSLRWELEQLASQMIAAQDLSGRSRRSQHDRERVRKAVSMAIGRALGTTRKHAPELAEHLQKHLEQGYFLSYTGTIPWKF